MKKHVLCILFVIGLNGIQAQSLSDYIVIDQFGYRPNSDKIAVIRDPQTGFDSDESFSPGNTYALVNSSNNQQVFTGTPIIWNTGAEDTSSGDKAWWFDFSNYSISGTYYILDVTNNLRSFEFEIREDIYNEVLKQAVRTFYYQRVGFTKALPYAEANWVDDASHMGSLQDTQCRSYDAPNDPTTEKDVSGGWYDAGDYNKYTNWTSNYIYEMLLAYTENPDVWGDDYDIPESGNNIPDILDEAKWGMDHLLKLQNNDGSMISVVSESHASPPSSATGQSLYGDINTSSTWNSGSTFAFGAKIFKSFGMTVYANTLEQAAVNAWNWATANPNIIWRNNDATNGSQGIGAGQQEVDDYGRAMYRLRAAAHLYEITEQENYKTFFENNYTETHMIAWNFVFPFEAREQETLLYYTRIPGVSTDVIDNITNTYNSSMNSNAINFMSFDNKVDPYMAHLETYTWGSNNTKAKKGLTFYNIKEYELNTSRALDAEKAAENYIHYLHGVNPLNLTYLTNMYNFGGDRCANQIYHTWFQDGTDWDETGVSLYGPAPGFVPGGPNPSYDRDQCCNSSCGSSANDALCNSISISPPKGQPNQKSYLDFNNNWPLNSWSISENSCGYQIAYIRLLSKFASESGALLSNNTPNIETPKLVLYPNPTKNSIKIQFPENIDTTNFTITISSIIGKKLIQTEVKDYINVSKLNQGIYILKAETANRSFSQKFIIQ
ncbi:glycoside hydrolase family 9 protein [uncultured Aquimarina sp.]|uniref:glycoside hydrolase family 9 protein n=1 Tax=uncultured Aquimarina sp. TaxID=575652 RepID=UPI00262F1A78|nr:glycoside hydrolase family 9 protein [uncultured Aquimarina sp.]